MGKEKIVNLKDHASMMEAMKKLYGRSEHDEAKDGTHRESGTAGTGEVVEINSARKGEVPHKAK
jgi:hypothetical protein